MKGTKHRHLNTTLPKFSIHFIPRTPISRRNFLGSQRTRTIGQTARASHFGRIRATKLMLWRGWCVERAARRLKGPRFVWNTVPATMRFSLRTGIGTSRKFAAGKVLSSQDEVAGEGG